MARKNGHGKLIMKDGSFIEGNFKDGEITGTAVKYNQSNNSEYSGEFVNGQLQGRGKVIMKQCDLWRWIQ